MPKLQTLRRVVAVCVFCAALAIASPAQTFTTLVNFDGNNGGQPGFGPLAEGTDGNLYGTTVAGGIYNLGTVFKMTPAGALTTIYTFCIQNRCPDGAQPEAGLLLGTDGNFYGTTYSGGTLGQGTVFKITSSGVLTVLHSFNTRDGANPYARLVQGADGNFYGTALGGAHGNGTIFKITYGGRLTMLHSFDSSDGLPLDPLLQASDGNFYGTTYGGAKDYGRIFKMTPSGTVTTLYSFCSEVGCTDGTAPSAGLVLGIDGNFYGTTQFNGATGYGTIFKVTPSGTLTTLHTFNATDGADPYATMIQATDGNLYGTTAIRGADNYGTIFQITPSGTFTTLYNFCSVSGCDDGKSPGTELLLGANGDLYGETSSGGTGGGGTIFSLNVGLGPTVTTLPASGNVGASVRVLGTNLTGATAVSFNGTPASFTLVSHSLIKTTIPTGATTGRLQVTTPTGTLTSNAVFRVIP